VRNWSAAPPPALVVSFIVAGCLLELTRGLSVLWMSLIALTLCCVAPRSCRQLLRLRPLRIGAGALVLVAMIAAGYVLIARTLEVVPSAVNPSQNASWPALTEHVLGQFSVYIPQLIGTFGWLDTPSPLLALLLSISLLGALVVLGLAFATRRDALVLSGLLLAAVVVTVGLIEWNYGSSGITWQARDGFPLYAGIPLLAGVAVPAHPLLGFGTVARRRMAVVVAVGVGVSQLTDYLWALRRNTVGLGSVVNLFQRVAGGWSPPLGTPFTVIVGVGTVMLYSVWLYRQVENCLPRGRLHLR
jgi:hypothetical protein